MCHTRHMPKRISTSHSQDISQAAFQMVHRLTPNDSVSALQAHVTSSEISRVMAAMGGRWGPNRRQAPTNHHDIRTAPGNGTKGRPSKMGQARWHTIMTWDALCWFGCKHSGCHARIALPQHTILQPFAYRDNPPRDIPWIAIACPACKTIENYSAADLQESAVVEISPEWEVSEWLGCDVENCESLVPVFVRTNETTTPKRGNLVCGNSHPIVLAKK